MNAKLLFLAAILLTVVLFGAAVLFDPSGKPRETAAPPDAGRPVAGAEASRLVRAHAPSFGPAEAKVTLVEFLDPACETCATFHPEVKKMLAANPGSLRLVMRHVPFHPGSEPVVALLLAAHAQGRYREAVEALFAGQDRWVQNHRANADAALALLRAVPGIDVARLTADSQSPAVRDQVAQDLADAKALRVTKTPEYFVNGKPLPTFGLDVLQRMVADALKK